MARQLDQASLDALKTREGCRLEAYQDEGGTWTIGYGDTENVHAGETITQEQADAWLVRDCAWACAQVEHDVTVKLTDNQFGALVSFCYNVGSEAFAKSTLLKKLNAGDYASVPSEMLKWANVHGVRDEGLVNRRNSEGGQWVKGSYVRGASITPDAPPKWHQSPIVRKLGGAVVAGAASISSQSVKTAADAAQNAITIWHGFALIGAVLTGIFVFWALFDTRKSQ